MAARGLVGCSWWCRSGTSETCCCGAICADGLDCCGTSCADAGSRCHRGDVINIPSWWGPWTWAYCSWRRPWRPRMLGQLYGTFWDSAATHQCDIFFFNCWGHGHITMAHSCLLRAAWHMHNATGAQTIWHLRTQCGSRRQGSRVVGSPGRFPRQNPGFFFAKQYETYWIIRNVNRFWVQIMMLLDSKPTSECEKDLGWFVGLYAGMPCVFNGIGCIWSPVAIWILMILYNSHNSHGTPTDQNQWECFGGQGLGDVALNLRRWVPHRKASFGHLVPSSLLADFLFICLFASEPPRWLVGSACIYPLFEGRKAKVEKHHVEPRNIVGLKKLPLVLQSAW